MKLLALALFAIATVAHASDFPPASEHIANCENHWFLKDTDDAQKRLLGFAYVDATAGVTWEHWGEVALGAADQLVRLPNPLNNARLIVRVSKNFPVACLGADRVQQLGLPTVSEFLAAYEDKREAGPHNVSWASHYNAIEAPDVALGFVEAAKKAGDSSPELALEEAYAYSSLQRFAEAITTLEAAIKRHPEKPLLRAELAYAYLSQKQYPQAIDLYKELLTSKGWKELQLRFEYANNLALAYQATGKEADAAKWRKKAVQWKQEREAEDNAPLH